MDGRFTPKDGDFQSLTDALVRGSETMRGLAAENGRGVKEDESAGGENANAPRGAKASVGAGSVRATGETGSESGGAGKTRNESRKARGRSGLDLVFGRALFSCSLSAIITGVVFNELEIGFLREAAAADEALPFVCGAGLALFVFIVCSALNFPPAARRG